MASAGGRDVMRVEEHTRELRAHAAGTSQRRSHENQRRDCGSDEGKAQDSARHEDPAAP